MKIAVALWILENLKSSFYRNQLRTVRLMIIIIFAEYRNIARIVRKREERRKYDEETIWNSPTKGKYAIKQKKLIEDRESRKIPFSFLTLLNNIYSKTERSALHVGISDPVRFIYFPDFSVERSSFILE